MTGQYSETRGSLEGAGTRVSGEWPTGFGSIGRTPGCGQCFQSLQLQGVAHKIKIFLQYPSHDYTWTTSAINASSIAHQSPENIDPLVNSTAPVSYTILSYEYEFN